MNIWDYPSFPIVKISLYKGTTFIFWYYRLPIKLRLGKLIVVISCEGQSIKLSSKSLAMFRPNCAQILSGIFALHLSVLLPRTVHTWRYNSWHNTRINRFSNGHVRKCLSFCLNFQLELLKSICRFAITNKTYKSLQVLSDVRKLV